MSKELIGRVHEQTILNQIMNSNQADLIAITGRRRVGKTFLIKSYFKKQMDFEMSGILNASTEQQLQNFSFCLKQKKIPQNWLEAFFQLSKKLDRIRNSRKIVVFIDEFPWLDTHKSNFLAAFDWFWNSWAVSKNIVVVICGSAASWMINKVLNNKGGLHNRVTQRIHLEPFNLQETELYLRSKKITLSRHQIIQLYMALGGIPHYLNAVQKGQSAAQNIHRICFENQGLLVNEFENLYQALFKNSKLHTDIVFALASKRKGLNRAEILKLIKSKDGGTFSKTLAELEWSGFISSYLPFDKSKKDTLYRLSDEYSLFYIRFMHRKKNVNWQQLAESPTWKAWSAYSFETLCMKHLPEMKKALGIASVYTEVSSFFRKGNADGPGTQIDLLLDRKDQVINLIEVKFLDKPFVMTKAYADELRLKMALFKQLSKTRKSIFLTMITSYGIIPNQHSIGFVQQELKQDDFF